MQDKTLIVLPSYNEAKNLENSVHSLTDYLQQHGLTNCDIVITNNNSHDDTEDLGKRICDDKHIFYHFVKEQGKGIAVIDTWLKYDGYKRYAFMDTDLSTDLNDLERLLAEIDNGYGLVIGSRYLTESERQRSPKREFVSFGYRTLFHMLFTWKITDPQCGFKAISKEVRDNVAPYIENKGFFFDTELIMRTIKAGYSVYEIPVTWKEASSSTLKFAKDVPRFLKGLFGLYIRLKKESLTKFYQNLSSHF